MQRNSGRPVEIVGRERTFWNKSNVWVGVPFEHRWSVFPFQSCFGWAVEIAVVRKGVFGYVSYARSSFVLDEDKHIVIDGGSTGVCMGKALTLYKT